MAFVLSAAAKQTLVDQILINDAFMQVMKGTPIATVRAAIVSLVSAAALANFDDLAGNFGT
jgi:hypothetical protein